MSLRSEQLYESRRACGDTARANPAYLAHEEGDLYALMWRGTTLYHSVPKRVPFDQTVRRILVFHRNVTSFALLVMKLLMHV
jgi:hypothetical protein